MLKVRRVPRGRLVGVIHFRFAGSRIKIYDLERALCEAYRLDPSGPLFLKALKRYVKFGEVNADKIHGYDKAVKTHVLNHLRQELADD